ncbi:hypothetical protein Tco_1546982, partial [Tanacetum coccineum]
VSYDSNLDEPTLLVTPLSDSNEDECLTPGDEFELLLHHDSSTLKMSVASILEGFTDEPPLKKNDDLFDLESKTNDWKKILYDAPIDDLKDDDMKMMMKMGWCRGDGGDDDGEVGLMMEVRRLEMVDEDPSEVLSIRGSHDSRDSISLKNGDDGEGGCSGCVGGSERWWGSWDGDGGDKGEGGGCGVVKVAVVWRGGGEGRCMAWWWRRRRVGGWIE